MAQWLSIFAALKEDPGLVPRTYMMADNYVQLHFQISQHLLGFAVTRHAHGVHT